MADYGSKVTDKAIAKLDKELKLVYQEAEADIQTKLNDFTKKFKPKWEIQKKKLASGEITQEQFDNWYAGQVFQREQWTGKKREIQQILTNSNRIATQMINGRSIHVFSANYNYESYSIEHGANIDFGFQLYDSSAVTNLIKNNPQVLPKWKINEPKDYVWNGKKVNRQVTQGIIQGESLDQIAERLAKNLSTQNMNHMRTLAHTAMTGAQNAGREQSLKRAQELGLNVVKEWMATLDGRTRDSHRHMDGETIKVGDKWHHYKFSNGLRYPGDPEGPAHEVFNCRCTLVGDLEDYPFEYERYDNIDGKPIKNMSYGEWYRAKYGKQLGSKTASAIDYSKYGGKEVFDIIKKYDTNDYSKFIDVTSLDDFDTLWNAADGDVNLAKQWFEKAKADSKSLNKAIFKEDEIQKKIAKAQTKVNDLGRKVKASGADKVFYDIWEKDVTYADWDEIKDSIQHKRDFYNSRIPKRRQKFIDQYMSDIDDEDAQRIIDMLIKHGGGDFADLWNDNSDYLMKYIGYKPQEFIGIYDGFYNSWNGTALRKMYQFLDDLDELEKHGAEYSKLLKDYEKAKKNLEEALKLNKVKKPLSTAGSSGFGGKTTEEWINKCKSNPDVDEMLSIEKATFKKYTREQVDALELYTGSSYDKMNTYLRLVGSGTPHEEAVIKSHISDRQLKAIKDCHEALTVQSLDRDMVLRRGTDVGDLAGLFMQGNFETNMALLEEKTAEELNEMFQGQVGKYLGFTSTSSQWDRGFSDEVEIVFFAPKGTPAASIMDISRFGTGEGETLLRDDITVVCDRIEQSDGHMGSSIRVFLQIIVD